MPRYIVKIGDKYGEWSTIVDAPVTPLVSLEAFSRYYLALNGIGSLSELEERMARVEAKGVSSHGHACVNDLLRHNRYGENDKRLSVKAVIKKWQAEQ